MYVYYNLALVTSVRPSMHCKSGINILEREFLGKNLSATFRNTSSPNSHEQLRIVGKIDELFSELDRGMSRA